MWERARQSLYVMRELTSREIKRKYTRSFLGVLWSVLNPLLNMIVLSAVFSTMFKNSIANFPVYYLTGSILWNLFSEATRSSMTVLVDNRSLLIKTKIPKIIFVLSRSYTALTNFFFSCIAYAFILAYFGQEPAWAWLLGIYILVCIMLFSIGIGALLSILYVFFADIKHLYNVLLTVWMYLSAIFYPVDRLSETMQRVLEWNPVYQFISALRIVVMRGILPEAGTLWRLGAVSAAVFAFGVILFYIKQNDVMMRI